MSNDRVALARVESSEMVTHEGQYERAQAQILRAEPRGETRVRQTEQVNDLMVAFAEAQAEFPVIAKSKTAVIEKGATRYTYKYADLADVQRNINPVLKKHGLAFMTIPTGGRLVGRLVHASTGQYVEGDLGIIAPGEKTNVQALGSALTYERRYIMAAMLGLSLDEDDDGSAASDDAPRRQRPAPADDIDPQIIADGLLARAKIATREEIGELMRRALDLPAALRSEPVRALVERLYSLAPNVDAVRALAKYAREKGCEDAFIQDHEQRRIAELQKPSAVDSALRDVTLADIQRASTPELASKALARARQDHGDRVEDEKAFAERIAEFANSVGDEQQLIALEAILKQARLQAGSAHLALATDALATARRDLASDA